MLKLGVVGFIAILSLAALAAWRWRRTGASAGPGADRQVGLLMLLGILAMSFTLGRAALPDGLFLLTVGLAWIRFPQAAGAL